MPLDLERGDLEHGDQHAGTHQQSVPGDPSEIERQLLLSSDGALSKKRLWDGN
jgi:hypothetical protein